MYLQTWHLVARLPAPARGAARALCSWLTSGRHRPSRTERGYGGGPFEDRWCRWCGKLVKVPRRGFREMAEGFGCSVSDLRELGREEEER